MCFSVYGELTQAVFALCVPYQYTLCMSLDHNIYDMCIQ